MGTQIQLKTAGAKTLKILFCAVLALCLAAAPVFAGTANAEGTIHMSTAYPGVTVQAGKILNFSVDVANDSSSQQRAELNVKAVPANWEGYFTGGGNQVTSVYVPAAGTNSVTFTTTVPANTAEGPYQIFLEAKGENGDTSILKLDINVSADVKTADTFTTQYTDLEGTVSTSFKYTTTLANHGSEEHSYSLAADAPAGWTVTFTPSYQSQQISSLTVGASGSQNIDVTVMPASTAGAGTYPIKCTASSDQGSLTIDLSVKISGTYKVVVTTPSGNVSADGYAGKENAVMISIYNMGTTDLMGVELLGSTTQPGWTVRFDPKTIDIPAGDSVQATAYITVPANTVVGDYKVTIDAGNNETSGSTDFTISVKASTTWGIIAIIVILLLVAGLIVVFMKFGRR